MTQAWDFIDDEILWGRTSRSILNMRLEDCDLPIRPINALVHNGIPQGISGYRQIKTIRELIECTEAELLVIPNFGRLSLHQVKSLLASLGLALKQPNP